MEDSGTPMNQSFFDFIEIFRRLKNIGSASLLREILNLPVKNSLKSVVKVSRAAMVELFTALYLLHAAQTVVGSSPKPPPMLVDMSAGTWIKKAQLPC